jgi:hypothetical protein
VCVFSTTMGLVVPGFASGAGRVVGNARTVVWLVARTVGFSGGVMRWLPGGGQVWGVPVVGLFGLLVFENCRVSASIYQCFCAVCVKL